MADQGRMVVSYIYNRDPTTKKVCDRSGDHGSYQCSDTQKAYNGSRADIGEDAIVTESVQEVFHFEESGDLTSIISWENVSTSRRSVLQLARAAVPEDHSADGDNQNH